MPSDRLWSGRFEREVSASADSMLLLDDFCWLILPEEPSDSSGSDSSRAETSFDTIAQVKTTVSPTVWKKLTISSIFDDGLTTIVELFHKGISSCMLLLFRKLCKTWIFGTKICLQASFIIWIEVKQVDTSQARRQ